MMVGEIFGELEASELIPGGDPPHDTGTLEIGKMPIGGTPRHVGYRVGNIRDAHGVAEGGQEFHDGLATSGVTLVDSLKVHLYEFMEIHC